MSLSSTYLLQQTVIVHIDDDELLLMAWRIFGEERGVKVLSFSCLEEFKKVQPTLDKEISIFIDYFFRGEAQGLAYAKELFDAGFSNIWLSTGAHSDTFKEEKWLRGVCGKGFPEVVC